MIIDAATNICVYEIGKNLSSVFNSVLLLATILSLGFFVHSLMHK